MLLVFFYWKVANKKEEVKNEKNYIAQNRWDCKREREGESNSLVKISFICYAKKYIDKKRIDYRLSSLNNRLREHRLSFLSYFNKIGEKDRYAWQRLHK